MTRTSSRQDLRSPLTLICSACQQGPFSYKAFRQAFTDNYSDETTGYRYMTTWSAISQSIDDDACSWCRIVKRIKDGLPTEKFPPANTEDVEVRLQVGEGRNSKKGLKICINRHDAATCDIYANRGDHAADEIGTNAPEKYYVDYPKVLKSIEQCNGHKHCPTTEETDLPTRVIDCSDPSKPRLVETQRKRRGRYCALSYVWGGPQHQETTTSNIDTYVRDGINVPLPQTIADAISVTNSLGIQYLWVDALCIVQNSIADKHKELAAMANIFGQAHLTISARSAFRADQGFLHEPEPYVLPFHLADESSPPGQMLLWPFVPSYHTLIPPLDQRGWCLQEGLLSPRVLTLQPRYAAYKCRSFKERDLRRTFVDQSAISANDHILFPTKKNRDSTSTSGKVDSQALQTKWHAILHNYSARKTTHPSDKLLAFASIVEVFQFISKDTYIAGLWQQSLLHDLLWETPFVMAPYGGRLARPKDYRAPSWSWASIDGPALPCESVYLASAAGYKAEILTWTATPKFADLRFGEIMPGASLTMKARMHPLSYGGQEVGTITFDCLEGIEEHFWKDFCLIMLRAGRERDPVGQLKNWIHGLIVLPVDGTTEQYRRVAKWRLSYNSQLPDWFDAMPLKTVTLV